ncbi:MAG: hypothetical protein KIS67_02890 [Verrucomicrobiae bacterium]|nr:hypothetical protein [Verrucomicrobiae bacterium]
METEIVVNGEIELIRELESLFSKHEIALAMANEAVKASRRPARRYSQSILGKTYNIAKMIFEFLNKKEECEAVVEVGESTTIITKQVSPDTIEKTISAQSGVRVSFRRKVE